MVRTARRRIVTFGAALSLASAMVYLSAPPPAGATKPEAGTHTIELCHVTNSAKNPWVLIEVDVAAFDGEGANDHRHHRAKDGRVDVPSQGGECPSGDAGDDGIFG